MNKKTIVITGAASGIGLETALLFAKNGWFVGLFDINQTGLDDLAAGIGPESCFSRLMDVSDADSVKQGIDAFAEKTGGKIHVLFNNAGILKFGLFDKVPLQDHLRIIEVNFAGCITCIFHCLNYLKQTPGARIINMSSASSIYGIPDLSVYSATKHALSAMTEALNLELERHNIHVCDIRPPYVKTPLLDSPEEIYSIKTMKVLLTPAYVAGRVWKAAHGRKLHWNIGATPALLLLFWLLPFVRRFAVKMLALPPEK